jgi:hypothetical protein
MSLKCPTHACSPCFITQFHTQKKMDLCGHICQGKLPYLDWQVEEISLHTSCVCVCVCVWKGIPSSTAKLKKHCLQRLQNLVCTWVFSLYIITQDLCVYFWNWIETKCSHESKEVDELNWMCQSISQVLWCVTLLSLPFTFFFLKEKKSILLQKKNYGNSNIFHHAKKMY